MPRGNKPVVNSWIIYRRNMALFIEQANLVELLAVITSVIMTKHGRKANRRYRYLKEPKKLCSRKNHEWNTNLPVC
jgi:hypothetical protein